MYIELPFDCIICITFLGKDEAEQLTGVTAVSTLTVSHRYESEEVGVRWDRLKPDMSGGDALCLTIVFIYENLWQEASITGNATPVPPRHFQVGEPLLSCLWVWGYWLNWFLADLYCPLLWCKEFLMMVCCQRRWNHRSLQTLLVYTGWHYDERHEHCYTAGWLDSTRTS